MGLQFLPLVGRELEAHLRRFFGDSASQEGGAL